MIRWGFCLAAFLFTSCLSVLPDRQGFPGMANAICACYPGSALVGGNTLSVAIPIVNNGPLPLSGVTLTTITVKNGTLVDTKLPYTIKRLDSGDRAVLFASFSGPFAPDHTYVMKLEGTVGNGIPFVTTSDLHVPPM